MTETETDYATAGYVLASRYRVEVLRVLQDGPAIPSAIAEEAGIGIAHVSRALGELRDEELVDLLVPEDRKKGRIYGPTEAGEEAASRLDDMDIGGKADGE